MLSMAVQRRGRRRFDHRAKQPVSYYLTKGTPSAYNFSAALAFIVIPLGLLAVARLFIAGASICKMSGGWRV